MGELTGKTALVTGSGRGIGRGIALRLAADGAEIIVNASHSPAQADAVAEEIRAAGGAAKAICADLRDLDEIKRLFAQIRKTNPVLDILVNNAGVATGGLTSLKDSGPDQFDSIFDLNVRALFFVTQEAVRMMADGGRIVNVSSTSSRGLTPGLSIYGASKAAVNALTGVWAKELGARLITVNAIAPGMVETETVVRHVPPEQKAQYGAMSPFGRLGRLGDIADVVAFLASEQARWVTGQVLTVSGGA